MIEPSARPLVSPKSTPDRNPRALKDDVTRENWRELLRELRCPQCQRSIALCSTYQQPNAEGQGLLCPCGEQNPLRQSHGILYLRKEDSTHRRKAPETPGETWVRCGDFCYICGSTAAVLKTHGIGRTQHHTKPYRPYGHEGVLIPVCAVCHEFVNAVQRTMTRFINSLTADDGA